MVKESAVELQSLAPSDDLEQSARLDVYGSAGGTVVEKLLGLMKEVQHDVGKLEQESVDRSLFDSTVHSLEHKMHTMLRVVSRTPGWTTQERQRVLEHADELYDEVEQLANTLERVKAEGTPNAEYLPTATTELLIRQISKAEAVVEHLHSHVERSTFRRWGPLMHGGMSSLMGEVGCARHTGPPVPAAALPPTPHHLPTTSPPPLHHLPTTSPPPHPRRPPGL